MRTFRARARAVARAVRHGPDRLLHPLRRRRARAVVRAARPVRRILILCHGNICRSPYAEVALRRLLAAEGQNPLPDIASAGFVGPGRPSPPEARAVARRRGLDLSGHRSRLVRADELGDADLVVVMDVGQRGRVREGVPGATPAVVLLGDFDSARIRIRRVLDPFERPEEVFEEVYGRIDRCLAELTRALLEPGPDAGGL